MPISTVEDLEVVVRQLPWKELSAFARWFEEYLADEWDKQIEEDAKAGRLDHLADQALKDYAAGLTKPL